jgi:poly(hydroxyalkanoate) granule-associated protein
MATRKKTRGASVNADRASQAVRDSAQKIWLAGLGAFERAKTDGPKMFETLVEQGRSLGTKAREGADQAMRAMREGAASGGARWDKLEQVFEDRVAKSLGRLGVITGREVDQLSRQVQELNESVRRMMSGGGAKPAARKGGGAKRKAKSKSKAKAGTRKARPRKTKS